MIEDSPPPPLEWQQYSNENHWYSTDTRFFIVRMTGNAYQAYRRQLPQAFDLGVYADEASAKNACQAAS